MVEKERPEVWDILEEVIREHPVLLNRAPTLHRLGIQAFEPVLIEGKAIQLHPLVCTAFNADFDGDQMAVHVPLSLEAQLEARVLMMSTNNILSPGQRQADHRADQDIVLGLYYLTMEARRTSRAKAWPSPTSARSQQALDAKAVTLHAKIKARYHTVDDENGKLVTKRRRDDAGPHAAVRDPAAHPNVPFALINRLLTKKEISNVIDVVYRHCGQKETVIFADRMMALGFQLRLQGRHLVRQGRPDHPARPRTSWSARPRSKVKEYEQQYLDGLITQGEKYNKVVDAWSHCTDKVADEMMKAMSEHAAGEPDQLGLHDGALRRPRLGGADQAARRHARPDGQAVGRDHRDADHLELQGRPDRARVLQLDPRRPQGPRRHGAEDRELGLSDPPPGRRRAGRASSSRRIAAPPAASP